MNWVRAPITIGAAFCVFTAGCQGSNPPSNLNSSGSDAGTPGMDVSAPVDAMTNLDNDGGPPRYTWWQDVQPIVREKCQLCHGDPAQFGAPSSWVTYADTQRRASTGAPVHAEMVQRITAPSYRMPPPSQPQLTEMEKEIIRIWSEIGAPEGIPPTDAGVDFDSGEPPHDAGMQTYPDVGPGRYIEVLATNTGTSAAYPLPIRDTNYVCWSVTVPMGGGSNEHAVRFEHVIDNTRNLHHMLLFRNNRGDSDPGPFSCGSFPLDWDMISGWAPGRQPEQLPSGVGVPLEPGTQLVLQAHYDDVRQSGITDNSGIRVVTVDQAGLSPAGIMWSGGAWFPAINGSNVRRRGTCRIDTPITIFQNFPHMHELGLRITLEVKRSGSSTWDLLTEVPAWDFEDQPNVSIPMAEQQLNIGDQLRTTCWWDTQGRDVNFGEETDDEMCFNFIYHHPLLDNPTLACASLLQ